VNGTGTGSRGGYGRRTAAHVAVVAAGSLVAGLLGPGIAFGGTGTGPVHASPGRSVPVHPVAAHPAAVPAMQSARHTPATWPAAGSGTAAVTTGAVRAGTTPVWIGPATVQKSATPTTSAVRSARVQVLAHQTASGLGITGTVVTVARSDDAAAAGRVRVSVDYSGFQSAYGGDYASRLRLVALPACALTAPTLAACRTQTPLDSSVDLKAARVGADVTLPASSGAVVLAATAAAQGSAGDYAAEPESEMDEWVSGGSSGAYKYTYPIAVPPVPGGLEPNASLRYDSQLTDGIGAAVNPEASEVGDGWQSAVPGSIEVDYQTCAANFAEPDILDLCNQVQSESLTQDGSAGPIVLGSGGVDKKETDDTSAVQQLSGGGWEITAPDGSRSYYGLNKLPGWVSGDPVTNSVWTVPLWAGNTEQTAAAGWRYLLDYVVDAQGNAIAYFYNTQTNAYATHGGSTANGTYTAGGVLAKTEYGLRDNGNVFTQTPAAEIDYAYATARQDAPTDLACTNGAACSVTAPTFWTNYALTGITTKTLVGGSLQAVDAYQLTPSYPPTGDTSTSPNLWLASIQQTGEDGGTPITLPPVSFAGTAMPNLDQTSADATAKYSLITRDRMTAMTNETGGVTSIAYTGEDSACSSAKFPNPWINADRCYPDYWYTNPLNDVYRLDWYNLYAVSSVTAKDTTGGGPPVVTSYTYGPPGWHYDNDSVSRSAYPTWDKWRGFQTVTTEQGTAPDPVSQTITKWFQGLSNDHGAYAFNGGEEGNGTVTLTTSRGIGVEDADQNSGMLLETRTFTGAGGAEVSDTEYAVPWSTETDTQTVNAALFQYRNAYLSDSTQTLAYTDLTAGGSQVSTTTYTLDSQDNELSVDTKPWGAPETCTTTSNVVNTADNLTEPKDVKVTAGSCAAPGALVSDTQYGYDGGAIGAAPTKGLVTTVQYAVTATGTNAVTHTAYDQYGRVTSTTDADNRTTTIAYSPATGAEPTRTTVTDPMNLATVTTDDPARDLELTSTDPAGYTTASAYDALGRTTAKWTAGNPTSGSAQIQYAYAVSQSAPSSTTTRTQVPGGGDETAVMIFDALGRAVETQNPTASGGSDITQTTYNSDGWKSFVSGPYYNAAAPSGTLLTAARAAVADETGYAYDGVGRVTQQTAYNAGSATWNTAMTYGGNYVTTVPPTGGIAQTEFLNSLNEETGLYEYHAGVTPSPSDPASSYDQYGYTYTAAGKLATVNDAAGNQWSYGYDLLGRAVTQAYPDTGTTTAGYDAAGQLLTVTDARGKTTSITYDADARRTAEYDTTGGAAETAADEIASWTWDTLAPGKLTSSSTYSGGAAYTQQATGYNSQGLPSGVSTVIPAAQGALAGTYTTSFTYAPDGAQLSYTDSAAGGLPAETVNTGYDSIGDPASLTGANTYVSDLSYTNLNQPLQYSLGDAAKPVTITDSYDPQTADLTEQQLQTGTAGTTADDLHYAYDADGLITSEADTPSGAGSATDVQCFSYDYLGRLSQAWAQGSTGCAANPTAAGEGGAAPYLEQYGYNVENNLTGVTSTSSSGAVTTTTLGYPAPGNASPHAVTSSTTTGGATTTAGSYGYDADGDLTSVSGSAGTDSLTWSDWGKLTGVSVTPAGGGPARTTGFVYDTNGNQLIRTDPGSVTLYLGDEELVLDTGTGTVSGVRYYSLGGQQVAVGAEAGGTLAVAWLAGDGQHTETLAVDASTLAVTRRWFDPYGNPRGTATGAFPAGQKGFVGGTADAATGLTNLGARGYQPATGSFISADPLLNPADPQDLNPYAYAEDDPSTRSDPTGQMTPNDRVTALDESRSWETAFGKVTITINVTLTSQNGSIVTVNVNRNGTGSVSVVTDQNANVTVALPSLNVVKLAAGFAAADQSRMQLTMDSEGRIPVPTYSRDFKVGRDAGNVTVGFGTVTASLSGTRTYTKGKLKIELHYTVTVNYEVTLSPGKPTAPAPLEHAILQAARQEGVIAAAGAAGVGTAWLLYSLIIFAFP
jgi:RHS repeat-associated protein